MIAVMAVCAGLLTGCGEKIAEWKIGKEARYYIADKYKFRPGTTDVELRKVGELEGIWHKKDAGTANMEYNGRTFKVYVSLVDLQTRYDDYLKPDVEEYLNDFFRTNLGCEDIKVQATYGIPSCMVPGDVKTVEDIFAKCDNIEIYVSTYGIDKDKAKALDVSGLGTGTIITVVDWSSKDCLDDEELMRETVVGLETNSYTIGFGKVRSYYRYDTSSPE